MLDERKRVPRGTRNPSNFYLYHSQ